VKTNGSCLEPLGLSFRAQDALINVHLVAFTATAAETFQALEHSFVALHSVVSIIAVTFTVTFSVTSAMSAASSTAAATLSLAWHR